MVITFAYWDAASPQLRVPMAHHTSLATSSVTKRTPPSIMPTLTPPGCSLIAASRLDPYQSDRKLGYKASMPALYEFCDQTAEALVMKITAHPKIKEHKTRVLLELGHISNKTATPTTDFEMMQKRLRNRMVNSDLFTQNFKILDRPGVIDLEKRRLGGDGLSARYAAEDTYVLLGDFMEARRTGTRRFSFEFKLVHVASREIIFTEWYDLSQED